MSSQTLEKAKKIVEKVKRKYYTQYQNAVVVLNPEHSSWRPLMKGVKSRPIFKELINTAAANPDKFNKSYRVLVQVSTNPSEGRLSVECNFYYFSKGKKKSSRSYAKVIGFSPNEVTSNPLTTNLIHTIVKKMYKIGAKGFMTLKPMSYDELMHL
jgi:hypothetical protein